MQAIINKCDGITNDIIERLNKKNIVILNQYNNYDGDNALGLAISHTSPHLVQIINLSNKSVLKHCNKHRYNSLMLAAVYGATDEVILLLLQQYKLSSIYKQTLTNNNVLILAAFYGHANIVKFLLKYYNSENMLNIKNINQETAMTMAATQGNLLCLQELLNKATALNLLECNQSGRNSLTLATINNRDKCIIPIIEKYENLISTNKINSDIWIAIQCAVIKDRLSCLKELLTKANTTILTMVTLSYQNNLMIAVAYNSRRCMNAILNHANNNEKEKILNQQNNISGNTAIMIAAKKGYHGCLVDLLKVATPEMLTKINNLGYNILMYAVDGKNILNIQAIIETVNSEVLTDILKQKSKSNKSTAIMIASRIGSTECLSLLLEQLTAKTVYILLETDSFGYSALIIAILHNNIHCFSSIVAKIEQFKNLIDIKKYENTYKHALMLTLQKNNFKFSTILIQYATTKILAATDDNGYNSLMFATAKNNESILSKILEKANSDMQLQKTKKYADTAITIAAKNGYVACLKLLLEKAIPEAVIAINIYGNDCLMLACINKSYVCVQTIIDKLNVITFRQNTRGNNAIMLAAMQGVVQSLQKLLAYPITTETLATTNHEGYNCLMIAIKHRHHQCMLDILEKANYDMLHQKNNKGDNALKLAKKYHNPYYNKIVAKQNYLIELKNNY